MKELARALLRAQDVNVLVVDWVYGASFAYNLVVENYKEVALEVSILINQMQVRETQPNIYTFILRSLEVDLILLCNAASISFCWC